MTKNSSSKKANLDSFLFKSRLSIDESRNQNYFSTALKVLRLTGAGYYSLLNRKNRGYKSCFYILLLIAALINMYYIIFAIVIDVYVNYKDVLQTAYKFPLILTHIEIGCQHIYLVLYWKDYTELTDRINNFHWVGINSKYKVWASRVDKIFLAYLAMMQFYILICVIGFLSLLEHRVLVYSSWYPFDQFHDSYYYYTMASQLLCALFVCFIFLGFDGLYVKLIVMMCWQIDILKSEFEAIEGHDSRDPRLISAIRHHQTILKLMSDMERVFNPMMLIEFLFTVLTLCFAMFITIQFKDFNIQVAQAMLITTHMTAQMFVFCWMGTELSLQAQSVRDAAYGCHWHSSALGFMSCVFIVITRCNKVFTFTAGKFVNIDLNTMVNIFQDTFSYMMVMINLVVVEEDPIANVTVSSYT